MLGRCKTTGLDNQSCIVVENRASAVHIHQSPNRLVYCIEASTSNLMMFQWQMKTKHCGVRTWFHPHHSNHRCHHRYRQSCTPNHHRYRRERKKTRVDWFDTRSRWYPTSCRCHRQCPQPVRSNNWREPSWASHRHRCPNEHTDRRGNHRHHPGNHRCHHPYPTD